MPALGTTITIGSYQIPITVLGLSLSIVLHAGILATLAFIPAGRNQPATAPPPPEFARGQPIRIGMIPPPRDPPPIATVPPPPLVEPTESFTLTVASHDIAQNQPAPIPARRINAPKHSPQPSEYWASFLKIIQTVNWDAVLTPLKLPPPQPPTPDHSTTRNAPATENDSLAAPTAPPATSPHSEPTPPANTPQGISRGATIINLPQPVYPRRSIRLGQEGTAIVEITVGRTGTVSAVRLRAGSKHPLLDNAALEAARHGQFSPALRNGAPLEAIVIVPFEFKLTPEHH